MGKKKKYKDTGTCTNCRTLETKLAELFDRLTSKEEEIQDLRATVLDLRGELQRLLQTSYAGLEGAKRWLAEHIGYDLRQVAKCPNCTSMNTTPANPEQIGARFICKQCGQVFFVVKVLSDDADSIRQACKQARQAEEVEVEVLPADDPYRHLGRDCNWVKALPKR